MFTDEDVLQSELTSLKNKIKVFEEIMNSVINNPYGSGSEACCYLYILKQYKEHFNL